MGGVGGCGDAIAFQLHFQKIRFGHHALANANGVVFDDAIVVPDAVLNKSCDTLRADGDPVGIFHAASDFTGNQLAREFCAALFLRGKIDASRALVSGFERLLDVQESIEIAAWFEERGRAVNPPIFLLKDEPRIGTQARLQFEAGCGIDAFLAGGEHGMPAQGGIQGFTKREILRQCHSACEQHRKRGKR